MKISVIFKILLLVMFFLSLTFSVSANEKPDAEKLFKNKCSLCHAIDKKKLGPAVSAMSRKAETLRKIILKGKSPMPSFAGKLSEAEINSLIDYLLANQSSN